MTHAAEGKFKGDRRAYDVLSDPTNPQEVRRVRTRLPECSRRCRSGDVRRARAGGGRRHRPDHGNVEFEFSGSDFGDVDIEDLFGDFFGRGVRAVDGAWGPIAGADQEAELDVTVEEAYRGGKRSFTISRPSGPRTVEVETSRRVSSTVSASGSPVKAGRARRARPPATCTWSCGSPIIPATASTDALSPSSYELTPWEAALGVVGRGRHARGRSQGAGASGNVERQAASPQRSRHAQNPRGTPGDLYARGADHGARVAHR